MHIKSRTRFTVSAIAASIALALSTAALAAPAPVAQTTGDSGFVATCVSPIDPGTNQQAPCAPNSLGHAQATGGGAFAGGEYSTASGTYSTAVGSGSTTASGWGSVALGVSDIASGNASVAIGDASYATTANSIAIGQSAAAGDAATPGAGGEIAIGGGSSAMGQGATAIGSASDASGALSTAVGAGSTAAGYGSVALGVGSVANRPDSVSVGDGAYGITRQITNVAAGSAPTDAVNVAQMSAGDLSTLDTSEAYAAGLVQPLNGRISDAMALAAAQAAMFGTCSGQGSHCLAVGGGTDRWHGGISVGYRQTIDREFSWSASLSASGHDTTAGVGFGVTW